MQCIHNTSLPLAELKHVVKTYCRVGQSTSDAWIGDYKFESQELYWFFFRDLNYGTSGETSEHQMPHVGFTLQTQKVSIRHCKGQMCKYEIQSKLRILKTVAHKYNTSLKDINILYCIHKVGLIFNEWVWNVFIHENCI